MEHLGYGCDAAESGQVALHFAAIEEYCAILLDINMPVMDGFAVAAHIRDTEGYNQQTPIIWISAMPPENITPHQRKLFTHFLEKPVRSAQLEAMFKKIAS